MITSVLMIRKISCLYFDKNKYSHIKAKYEYLLSNQNYLWYVLDKSSPVCSDEDNMGFVSNEVKSDIVITIVINPLCDKCFGIIERVWMLNTYKINIVFVANYNNEKSINVSKTMISYSKNHNWNDTYIMLENWYKKRCCRKF